MMICKADFEELFPKTFKPDQRPVAGKAAGDPGPSCIARWEDDGGRTRDQRRRDASDVRTAGDGHAIPNPMTTSFSLATMPAAAAYGATWTMLLSLGRMAAALTSPHMRGASPNPAMDGQTTEDQQSQGQASSLQWAGSPRTTRVRLCAAE